MPDAKHLRTRRRAALRVLAGAAATVTGLLGVALPVTGPQSAAASSVTSAADASVSTPIPAASPVTPAPKFDLGSGVDEQITVEIATESPTTDGSDDVTGVVVIRNRTDTTLRDTRLRLGIGTTAFATRDELQQWLAPPTVDEPRNPGDLLTGNAVATTVSVPEVQPDTRVEVQFSLPAESLAAVDWTTASSYPLRAQLIEDREVTAEGHGVLSGSGAVQGEPVPTPYRVNVVVPVLAVTDEGALIDAATLETLTRDDGRLSRLLDAVEGTSATLAIDPRLLVSIRALGEDAPGSAVAWLDRLESLENPSFPLSFADANLSLQQQAGLEAPLRPESFVFATDGHSFTAVDDAPASPSPTASETATAEPEAPATQGAPSAAQLQSFSYSDPDVVWPVAGTVTNPSEFASWASDGRNSVVLVDGAQVTDGADVTAAAGSLHRVDKTQTVVTDDFVESAIARVVESSSDRAHEAALSELVAATTVSANRDAPIHVVTLPRREVADPERLAQLLQRLDSLRSATLDTFPAASAEELNSFPEVDITPGSVSEAQLSAFSKLERHRERGLTLTGLYDVPQYAKEELHVEFLRAISAQRLDGANAQSVVDSFGSYAVGAWRGVTAEQGSEIQLIGRESAIPLFITNRTDRQVNVEIRLRATTGHLQIERPVTVAVAPQSVTRAQIPVEAIANGATTVIVTLWTPDGVQLPTTASFPVNINTNLETVIVAVLGALVLALLVAGFIRTRRRILEQRAGSAAESSDDVDTDDAENRAPTLDSAAAADVAPADADAVPTTQQSESAPHDDAVAREEHP